MVGSLAKKNKVKVIKASRWFPVSTAEDLEKVEDFIRLFNKKPAQGRLI